MKTPTAASFLIVAALVAAQAHASNSCIDVSVEGDATYCVSGPVCSGAGDAPAGLNCPKKGDVAVKHCHDSLTSYVSDGDKCIARVDAQCHKIATGAYGCVWAPAPCIGIPGWEKPPPVSSPVPSSKTPCPGLPGSKKPSGSTPCPGVPGWEKPLSTPTTATPCPAIPGWEKPASSTTPTPPETPAILVPTTTAPPAPAPVAPTASAPAPAVAAAVQLSAVHGTSDATTAGAASTTHRLAISAAVVGAAVAAAIAVVAAVLYKKNQNTKTTSDHDVPRIYHGDVQTPV